MSKILEEFERLVTTRPHYRARGFVNINCPACGDRRKRGGFATTPSGGFRYFCFNGGCDYHNQPTGWEPGNGLVGRVRRLFDALGGNLDNIPLKEVMRERKAVYDAKGNILGHDKLEIARSFKEINMPAGTDILLDAAEEDDRALAVLEYLVNRGEFYLDRHPFMWSTQYPDYLLIPYVHYDKIVGYLGRNINVKEGAGRFIQRSPDDYLFNQHTLNRTQNKHVLVMESPMDALAVYGIATRGSKFTQKQVNLLRLSGKTPILVPDQRGTEWNSYLDTANDEGWPVSIPAWGKGVKDVGESVKKNGLLYTLELIMNGRTTNHTKARLQLASQIGGAGDV